MTRRSFLAFLAGLVPALMLRLRPAKLPPVSATGERWRFQPGGEFVRLPDKSAIRAGDLVLFPTPDGGFRLWHCDSVQDGHPIYPGPWGHTALSLRCGLCSYSCSACGSRCPEWKAVAP